jgi:hypothetical protein
VRNDFVGVRDAVVTTGTTGETAPAAVKLGTRFPGRTLFVNPPPAVGRIETGEPRNVTLNVSEANFDANPPKPDEVRDGWPTAAATSGNYTSRSLVYTPQYRSYSGGPNNITLELSHAVSRYSSGQMVNLTEAPLLARGDRVTLFLLRGDLSETGVESVTLEPSAVSPVSQRVRVSNFVVTVPTSLTASQFERRMNQAQVFDSENVTFSNNGSRVDVRFKDNRSLAISVVSLGQYKETRTASAVEFTSVEETVTQGESARVTVRVRDQYGNTLPNAEVTANMSAAESNPRSLVTDGTGQATFEFDTRKVKIIENNKKNVAVNVTVDRNTVLTGGFEQDDRKNATTTVTVENPNRPSNPNPNGTDGDAGTGGVSNYSKIQKDTISSSGGLWKEITNADAIRLSKPKFSPIEPDQGDSSQDSRYTRLAFTIGNENREYTFVLGSKQGIEYRIQNSGVKWQRKKVTLYRYNKTTSSTKTLFDGRKLTDSALDSWRADGSSLDILLKTNYEQRNNVEPGLAEVRAFMNSSSEKEMFITDMHGRTDMEIGKR